jgi:hypothetical protein
MQLDIFDDSRDVMLRNDLVEALLRRDAMAAVAAHHALSAEYPNDHALKPGSVLIDALGHTHTSTAPFTEAAEALAARLHLEQQLAPAATALLGESAPCRTWLRGQWHALAQRAANLPYRRDTADSHAAALWLRAGGWPQAADAVHTIEAWRRIPAPLAWMTEATWHLRGADAAWPLLAELCWLAPARARQLLPSFGDATLNKLLRRFDAEFEDDRSEAGTVAGGDARGEDSIEGDMAWWPAWALIDQPRLAPLLAPCQFTRHTPPEQATQLVLALLRLERQGRHHDIVEHRKRLKGLHAGLFSAYMKTR